MPERNWYLDWGRTLALASGPPEATGVRIYTGDGDHLIGVIVFTPEEIAAMQDRFTASQNYDDIDTMKQP